MQINSCQKRNNKKKGSNIRLRKEAKFLHDTIAAQRKFLAEQRRPFEILERIGLVVDRLSLHVPLDEIKVDKTLRFVKEPVENSVREVKRLKCSRMVVVKVHLDSKWGLYDFRYGVCDCMCLCVFICVYVGIGNQSIECDHLNGIGFVLDFVEFISFTFGDKEMISVIEAVSR
ncbi:hypothetical protein Tco_1500161 [Tanacetum coccineum]